MSYLMVEMAPVSGLNRKSLQGPGGGGGKAEHAVAAGCDSLKCRCGGPGGWLPLPCCPRPAARALA